jgi:tRNA_anti-like
MKKIIYAVIALALIGGAYGYYEWNRPVASNAEKTAEMTISASDLEAAYTANEADANTKYNDKLVQVSGIVSKIENEAGKTSIYLNTNNPMAAVICELEKDSDVSNIKDGDNVTIKGKPTGILSDVVMVQCVLSK